MGSTPHLRARAWTRAHGVGEGEGVRAPGHLSLYWNVCLTNGAVFLLGTLVLVVSPLSVSSRVVVSEAVVLAVGLAVMLTTNALLIRRSLAPLDRVIRRLEGIDHLRPGDLPEEGSGPVRGIARAVNGLLDRLEAERRDGKARALAAQEAERHRIAQELHDEVGQSLTVVLLGLKRVQRPGPGRPGRRAGRSVRESARAGLDDVRRVARRLRPGVLEDLGLTSALAALATDFAAHSAAPVRRSFAPGLPGAVAGGGAGRLPGGPGGAHQRGPARGRRGRSRCRCHRRGDGVELEVRDDGRGFAGLVEGSGLLGMRERAALVDAELLGDQPAPAAAPRSGCGCRCELPDPDPAGRRPRAGAPRRTPRSSSRSPT